VIDRDLKRSLGQMIKGIEVVGATHDGVSRAYTSDGGPARAEAWLQPRTSLRCDLGDAWIEEVLGGRPTPRLRVRRQAARLVKRMR
jgi:hypothetical protein